MPPQNEITPDQLLAIVHDMEDARRFSLSDYARAIAVLHDQKGYSFRKIVDFLKEQGVECNRSSVYEAYKDYSRGIPDSEQVDPDPLVDSETGEIVEE